MFNVFPEDKIIPSLKPILEVPRNVANLPLPNPVLTNAFVILPGKTPDAPPNKGLNGILRMPP